MPRFRWIPGRDPVDFDEEIRSHIALEVDRLVETGLSRQDAETAARRSFGNVTFHREEFFLGQHFALTLSRAGLAMRRLRRAPVFAFSVVVILGLTLGAATIAWSAVYATVLRPLPFRDGASLVDVWGADDVKLGGKSQDNFDGETLRAWKRRQTVFSEFTAWTNVSLLPRTRLGQSFAAAQVDGHFFSTLGIPVSLGRPIGTADDDASAAPVIVLSHRLWERAFGGDSLAIGSTWRLNTTSYTVVGVVPPISDIPGGEAWVSAPGGPSMTAANAYEGIGRLKPGISATAAQARLSALVPRPSNGDSGTARRGALVDPLTQSLRKFTHTLTLVVVAVALLLAVAIANLGTLFLVRSLSRLKQSAISTALGATAGRVRMDAMLEGAFLGGIAALIGIAVAAWARVALDSFITERVTQYRETLPLGPTIIASTIFLGCCVGAALTLLPERITRQIDLTAFLHGGGAGSGITRTQARWRHALVALQVASAVVACVIAAALIRSSRYYSNVDVGYDAKHIAVVPLEIWNSDYGTSSALQLLIDRIDADLANTPGLGKPVAWASFGFPMPSAPGDAFVTAEGSVLQMDMKHCSFARCAYSVQPVSTNFFATLGVALEKGRYFGATDRAGSEPVAIVNGQAARTWWPGEEPIGKRIRLGGARSSEPWLTVVGVVANAAPMNPFGRLPRALKASNVQPLIYQPLAQVNLSGPTLPIYPLFIGLHTNDRPELVATSLRRRLASVLPDMEIPAPQSMQAYLQSDYTAEQLALNTSLAMLVTLVTVLLAMIGIMGVVAESVRHRTREFGVRLALGATKSNVVQLVCRGALGWLGAGVAVGIAATLLLRGPIARVVFNASQKYPDGILLFGPTSPTATLIASSCAILLVGLAAAYVPARLAAKLDPLIALRANAE